MKDTTSRTKRCTIQHRDGSFCDNPGMPIVSFPVCQYHAVRIYQDVREVLGFAYRGGKTEAQLETDAAEERKKYRSTSVVYYVREHDHIKIGTTINLTQRLQSLRIEESALLGTEPGSFDVEKKRHAQFKHLRIGKRENFRPEFDLIQHIDSLRD